jgi:dienelactone hydrolase
MGKQRPGNQCPGNQYPGNRHVSQPAGSGMSQLKWLMVVAFLMLTAVGCESSGPSVAAFGPGDVQIPPIALPMARMPSGPIPATFELPSGKGPFPAVIVLHGCGGRGTSQLIWARRLTGWGYAALIPDSLTPRGVKRICEPAAQSLVTPRDRVGDVGSAVAWLRTRPEIDPGRIAVLGLSHGGATAVMATERDYASFRLRAAIDYYGPCVDPAEHGDVPLLVLAGGADDWGHPAERCLAFGQALKPGTVFKVYTYPGVYHAFDNPDMVRTVGNSHIMEYDKAAAEDSFARVHTFLEAWVSTDPHVESGQGKATRVILPRGTGPS